MSLGGDGEFNPYAPSKVSDHSPPMDSYSAPLASRWIRLVAAIVDSIVLLIIFLPLMFVALIFLVSGEDFVDSDPWWLDLVSTALGFVMYVLINGYFLATRGQTIGKMLLKVRIVDYKTDQLVPVGKLIGLRLAPFWLVSAVPFGGIVGLVDSLAIFADERRCLHDMLCGTKVIEVR